MNSLLVVAAGGAIGASARHLVNLGLLRLLGPGFPYGTLTANVLGSLLMGILIESLALKFSVSNEVRLFAATGILGGFTTFSAFSLDVALMLERGQTGLAALYIAVSVALSIGALFAGLALTRWVLA